MGIAVYKSDLPSVVVWTRPPGSREADRSQTSGQLRQRLHAEEVAVSLVIRLFDKRISKLLQEIAQCRFRVGRDLQTDQDLADVCTVITVVE